MLGFRTYTELKSLEEGTYPLWIRTTTGALLLRINSLKNQIAKEPDEQKRDELLSKQNALIGLISGISIGVSSTDRQLLNRLKGRVRSK